ncbi:MAG: aspartate carbamoyltransferase catalytic subunit [Candidatus Electryonea clarkiae]|nr:aspartate carbamoyltransferase catalytic subunit [Candidatus Electryonea clarkiae]MDP8288390.1 aspartate carbamoyltransferase catalytic subunit [Candidatus Electryonea clarkiae]
MALQSNHLLGLEGTPREDIQAILDSAISFKEILERPIPKVPTLRHVTVVNAFFENSTRTRISFELAQKRLSADVVNFSASTSSVSKGETLIDTIRNLEAMKIDVVVMRHPMPGAPVILTKYCSSKVINAGDGPHEHPTQALLDMMTLREAFGSFENLNVTLIGDIAHSRVALSNIYGLLTMGANVAVCGPPTLIPRNIESLGVKVYHDADEALAHSDCINVLRIQLERQKSGLFPSIREYHSFFGITRSRLLKASKDLVILHPGPMNRGVEIDSDVADGPQSVILQQVTNGVAIRMAVLFLIAGGEREDELVN